MIKQQKLFSTLKIILWIITEQKISILEWFVKVHVTMETGVMMLKIQIAITLKK